MKKIVASRTMFCEHCCDKERPLGGDYFALFGHTRNDYIVTRCVKTCNHKDVGYTPHLISLDKTTDDYVIISTLCGMNTCGIFLTPSKNDAHKVDIAFYENKVKTFQLSHIEFKALMLKWKMTGYEI